MSKLVLNRTYSMHESFEDLLFDRINLLRELTFVGQNYEGHLHLPHEFLYSIDSAPMKQGVGRIIMAADFLQFEGNVLKPVNFKGIDDHIGYKHMIFWEGEVPDQYSLFKDRLDAARETSEREA